MSTAARSINRLVSPGVYKPHILRRDIERAVLGVEFDSQILVAVRGSHHDSLMPLMNTPADDASLILEETPRDVFLRFFRCSGTAVHPRSAGTHVHLRKVQHTTTATAFGPRDVDDIGVFGDEDPLAFGLVAFRAEDPGAVDVLHDAFAGGAGLFADDVVVADTVAVGVGGGHPVGVEGEGVGVC